VCVARFLGRQSVVRVGGDFLWEEYIERTRESLFLSEFYLVKRNFSFKEKLIFRLTRFVCAHTDRVIFSTSWQKNIWSQVYNIDPSKIQVIENVFQNIQKKRMCQNKKFFMSPSRDRYIKIKIC